MAYSRSRDQKGLNIPDYQNSQIQNVKHETVIVPSTSQVAFGAYSIFDFKEKACLINDIVLQFQVTNLSAGPANPNFSVPRLMPCFNWFTRIEIVQNNQILETIYPQANFLLHQMFLIDEERQKLNDGAGDYKSPYKCYLKTQNQSYWYLPLWTYFKTGHIPCLYPKDDIQIRLYMDTLANNIYTDTNLYTGVPTCGLIANLVVNVTRLGEDIHTFRLQSLNKGPEHYKYLEMRYGTTVIPANSNPAPAFNYVLNAVTGNVVFLLAIIRPAGNKGPGSTPTAQVIDPFQYIPVSNFSLLDSTSTNISGGQPVSLSLLKEYLSRKWTASSYYSDCRNVTVDALINNPNSDWWKHYTGGNYFSSTGGRLYDSTSHAILYSFADDPVGATNSGKSAGSHRFKGSEQLQVQFSSPLNTPYNLDIYAYVEGALETTPSYIKKVTL